jgi:hypothetical protein
MDLQDVGYTIADPYSKHEYEEVKLLRRMHGTRVLANETSMII